jgi:hypothetical protein
MKRFLVFTLVLTIIFPAYCFATPQRIIPIEDEILEEIMLIMEDGVVEEGEVASFIAVVIPDDFPGTCIALYSGAILITLLLTQLDFSGSTLEILLDVIMLFYGIWLIISFSIIGAYACDTA